PGYGYAKRTYEDKKRWSALTDGYFTGNRNIDSLRLVCQLVDSRTGPTSDDLDMLYYLKEVGLPHIIVATKTDKLNATEKNKFLTSIAEEELTRDLPLVMYSSKTNNGRVELWNHIYSACEV
ncbi:MAG: YihA family ribosome biogenesis GTP-binding protein, partial [Clostridia bacterium]|nr:YihA family ribosome biogenesis GTP-binding protein [Clostridia bacterium]